MSPKPFRTFNYHAFAHAFSCHFTRPFHELIDVQAASSLPVTGGHGNARVENFQFREFISFRKGYTHVSGAPQADDGSNNTLVTSTVEGLNLLDIVTADRITARLYSKHGADAKEGSFTMVGSKFENLRIAGCDVKIELDLGVFEKVPTFVDAVKDFENKGDFFKIAHDPFKTGQSIARPDPYGAFLCSCVKEMSTSCPGVTRTGHCFHIPGFGKIYLGEVLIKHGERIITMIRFELGSSIGGGGSGISGGSNGQHWP
jgi:hypothetical protein